MLQSKGLTPSLFALVQGDDGKVYGHGLGRALTLNSIFKLRTLICISNWLY
jgi:hypothetical protein